MLLSLFLIFIFLILALVQIYFLGLHFSITQQVFATQKATILVTGFVFYIFITFTSVLPFYFFSVSPSFVNVTLAIKDIFVVLFLISRRDFFKKNKFNVTTYGNILVIAIMIILVFYYVSPYLQQQPFSKIKDDENYFLMGWITKYLQAITFANSETLVLYFYLWPLLTIGMVAIVVAFYGMFIKDNNFLLYALTLVAILALLLLFNFNASLETWFSFLLLFFLFQVGMYVIIYSRRRYLIMFAVGQVAVWALNGYLFVALIALDLCLIFAYIILNRPRPPFFIIQLLFPILALFSFWVRTYSSLGAIILGSIIIITYIALFYSARARFNLIENNFFVRKLHLIVPSLIFIVLFLYTLVKAITLEYSNASFLLTSATFLKDFNNRDLAIVINIIYYLLFIITVTFSIYYSLRKKRIIGYKLVMLICSLIFVFVYNPLVIQTLLSLKIFQLYIEKLSIITIMPILIISLLAFIQRGLKLSLVIFNLKTTNSNNYMTKKLNRH